MIVCNNSNSEDCPPEMRCPGQDGKRPKYCGDGAMVAHQPHKLETTFESFVRNQI